MQLVPAINKPLELNMMICHHGKLNSFNLFRGFSFYSQVDPGKARGFWPKETKDLFLTNSLLGIIDKKFKVIEEKFE
jgi:hypothetical protein